jgi:hypothetical protein
MGKKKDWQIALDNDPHYFSVIQENMYVHSDFLYYKWYRKLYGGEWRLLHLVKDAPYIRMFSIWTKVNLDENGQDRWSGYYEVLETENYPETGVNTRWKLFKEFFKQKFSK